MGTNFIYFSCFGQIFVPTLYCGEYMESPFFGSQSLFIPLFHQKARTAHQNLMHTTFYSISFQVSHLLLYTLGSMPRHGWKSKPVTQPGVSDDILMELVLGNTPLALIVHSLHIVKVILDAWHKAFWFGTGVKYFTSSFTENCAQIV